MAELQYPGNLKNNPLRTGNLLDDMIRETTRQANRVGTLENPGPPPPTPPIDNGPLGSEAGSGPGGTSPAQGRQALWDLFLPQQQGTPPTLESLFTSGRPPITNAQQAFSSLENFIQALSEQPYAMGGIRTGAVGVTKAVTAASERQAAKMAQETKGMKIPNWQAVRDAEAEVNAQKAAERQVQSHTDLVRAETERVKGQGAPQEITPAEALQAQPNPELDYAAWQKAKADRFKQGLSPERYASPPFAEGRGTGAAPTGEPGIVPPRPPQTGRLLPQLDTTDSVIAHIEKTNPELLKGSFEGVSNDVIKAGFSSYRVAKNAETYADQLRKDALMLVRARVGDPKQVFGLDPEGRVPSLAKPGKPAPLFGDVYEHADQFPLNTAQKSWIDFVGKLRRETLEMQAERGVPGAQELLEKDARNFPRSVVDEFGKPAGGGVPGLSVKPGAMQERVYPTMEEGAPQIALKGHHYNPDPMDVLGQDIENTGLVMGHSDARKLLEPFITGDKTLGNRMLNEPGLFGQMFPTHTAKFLKTLFHDTDNSGPLHGIMNVASAASGTLKTAVLTGDVRHLATQGAPALPSIVMHDLVNAPGFVRGEAGHEPLLPKLLSGIVRSVVSPTGLDEAYASAELRDIVKFHRSHGGRLDEMSEQGSHAMAIEELVRKLPGAAGNILGTIAHWGPGFTNRVYQASEALARLYAEKALLPSWTRRGEDPRELVDLAMKLTGRTPEEFGRLHPDTAKLLGVVQTTPQWNRATIMNLQDLFRGTATGAETRKNLGFLLTAQLLSYTGVSLALGQEPKIKPWPKKFGGDGADVFTVVGPDGERYGDPIAFLWVIRSMADIVETEVNDPGAIGRLDQSNPLIRLMVSKFSPLANSARELATGRDYMGREIFRPEHMAEDIATWTARRFMPMSLDKLVTSNQATIGMLSGQVGVNPKETTLLDREAIKRFPTNVSRDTGQERRTEHFSDLPRSQRNAVLNDRQLQPKLLEEHLRPPERTALKHRVELGKAADERDNALKSGQHEGDWAMWQKARSEAAVKEAGYRSADQREFPEPTNKLDKALDGYYKLAESFDKAGVSAGARAEALDEYLAHQSPEAAKYVAQELHPNATAIEKKYIGWQERLRPFWDAGKNKLSPDELKAYKEYEAATPQQRIGLRADIRNRDLLNAIETVNRARTMLRQDNQAIDAIYTQLYRNGYGYKNATNAAVAEAGKMSLGGVRAPKTR